MVEAPKRNRRDIISELNIVTVWLFLFLFHSFTSSIFLTFCTLFFQLLCQSHACLHPFSLNYQQTPHNLNFFSMMFFILFLLLFSQTGLRILVWVADPSSFPISKAKEDHLLNRPGFHSFPPPKPLQFRAWHMGNPVNGPQYAISRWIV